MWGKCGERKQKNPRRTYSARVLCTRKTICFRTALWKTWDEYIVSGSISRRLMIWKKQRGEIVSLSAQSLPLHQIPQYLL